MTANPDLSDRPALLNELTPEQFALWRRHPVTVLIMERYLPDFRASLERSVLNAWVSGGLTLNAEQEARGYVLTAHHLEGLDLDRVRNFYGLVEYERPRP